MRAHEDPELKKEKETKVGLVQVSFSELAKHARDITTSSNVIGCFKTNRKRLQTRKDKKV